MTQPPMSATILVVEDDAATNEYFVDLLSFEGYDVRVAALGRAALDALNEHEVQLVLLDRRLPDMDGFAVCREIRARHGVDLPVILLTADHAAGLGNQAHEAGVTEFLAKPFDGDVLLDRIADLIRR